MIRRKPSASHWVHRSPARFVEPFQRRVAVRPDQHLGLEAERRRDLVDDQPLVGQPVLALFQGAAVDGDALQLQLLAVEFERHRLAGLRALDVEPGRHPRLRGIQIEGEIQRPDLVGRRLIVRQADGLRGGLGHCGSFSREYRALGRDTGR